MGIKGLQQFFNHHIPDTKGIKTIYASTLADKPLAIDISIYLYQYACAIKNSVDDIYNQDGEVITHIQAILNKALGLIKKKIKPIFVFDGKAPDVKNNVLQDRYIKKNAAKDNIVQLNTSIQKLIEELKSIKLKLPTVTMADLTYQLEIMEEIGELKKLRSSALKKSTSISRKQMTECKELLTILGIPIIESLGEADPQCSNLVKTNMAYGVASEDMDILTFGTQRLIRKLASGNDCIMYDLDIILKDLNITYLQFVDVCILLGCDYTRTIPGIGSKKILALIKEHGNIENFILSTNINIPDDFDFVKARQGFLEPQVKEVVDIKWSIPDYVALSKLLKEKYSYSHDEVDKLSNVLSGGYYSVISGEKTLKQYKRDCTAYINSKRAACMDSDDD
jgi:flap endonuclease-1